MRSAPVGNVTNEIRPVGIGSRDVRTSIRVAPVDVGIRHLESVDRGSFRYLRTNPALHRATGLGPEEMGRTTLREFFGEKQGAQIGENYRLCASLARPLT